MRVTRMLAVLTVAALTLGVAMPLLAQGASPGGPGAPGTPGTPGTGPGVGPGYGPGYGPEYGPWMGPYGRRGGFGPGFGARRFGPGLWAAGLFMLLRLLFLVGLILLIWRVLTAGPWWRRVDAAGQILRERYARGEISEDEYRKRLTTLA